MYLIQFYDIRGHEYWGESIYDFSMSHDMDSNSASESDDSSQETLSLEDAIINYPERAIEELAARVGIAFERIRDFYDKMAKYKQRPQQQAAKRQPQEVFFTYKAGEKRAKRESPPLPIPSVSFPPQSVRQRQSTPSDSRQTRLEWDLESTERRREALRQKMDPGSTTEENTPQTSQERLHGRKKASESG